MAIRDIGNDNVFLAQNTDRFSLNVSTFAFSLLVSFRKHLKPEDISSVKITLKSTFNKTTKKLRNIFFLTELYQLVSTSYKIKMKAEGERGKD